MRDSELLTRSVLGVFFGYRGLSGSVLRVHRMRFEGRTLLLKYIVDVYQGEVLKTVLFG